MNSFCSFGIGQKKQKEKSLKEGTRIKDPLVYTLRNARKMLNWKSKDIYCRVKKNK